MKNVFAFTMAGPSYPGYISVNEYSDNKNLSITVRTHHTNDAAGIQLPEAEAVAMARAILAHYAPERPIPTPAPPNGNKRDKATGDTDGKKG